MAKHSKKFLTAVDRIQFVIEFARMNLQKLREGDRLNLKEDFVEFLSPRGEYNLSEAGGVLALPAHAPMPNEYSEADFSDLQKEVQRLLAQAAAGSTGNRFIVTRGGPPLITEYVKLQAEFVIHGAFRRNEAPFLAVQGATRDVFLVVVFFLLLAHGLEKIQLCPQCQRVFSQGTRRQIYCSRPCANLASVKAFHSRAKAAAAAKKKASRRKGGK